MEEEGAVPSFGSDISLYWFRDYGTGSLALQTPSTANYKTVSVNLCTKTKHGGGECSSLSVFFPLSVLF